MRFCILNNGNLEIVTEEGDKAELQDILDKTPHRDHGFLADMLEYAGWQANGELFQVSPEHVGALTDAPILSDDVTTEDDGTVRVKGRVWWFPQYESTSFAETLLETGRVVFAAAPENS